MESVVTHEAEVAAAHAALAGTFTERVGIAVRALAALLENPDDTRQVFLLGMATNRGTLPRLLTRVALSNDGARMLREQPAIDSKHVDYEALRRLPDG